MWLRPMAFEILMSLRPLLGRQLACGPEPTGLVLVPARRGPAPTAAETTKLALPFAVADREVLGEGFEVADVHGATAAAGDQ